jgi:hypothetical protein
VFALFDRRVGVRAAGVVVVALVSALMVGTAIGTALLAVGAGVVVVCAIVVARGDHELGLDVLAGPALGTAAVALSAVLVFGGEAVADWESSLRAGVTEGGRRAIDQYRAFGMSVESLAALESLIHDVAAALVAIWPALTAVALWLGTWLAHRLLGRWGRVGSALGRRLAPRPFEFFRPAEVAVWSLIAGLAGLWADAPWLHRAAANAALAFGIVYAMTGLAVTWWWLGRRGMGTAIRAALVGVATLFLTPFAAAAWVTIGLADVWLGFREEEKTS